MYLLIATIIVMIKADLTHDHHQHDKNENHDHRHDNHDDVDDRHHDDNDDDYRHDDDDDHHHHHDVRMSYPCQTWREPPSIDSTTNPTINWRQGES